MTYLTKRISTMQKNFSLVFAFLGILSSGCITGGASGKVYFPNHTPQSTDRSECPDIIQEQKEAVNSHLKLKGQVDSCIRLELGIASCPGEESDPEQCLRTKNNKANEVCNPTDSNGNTKLVNYWETYVKPLDELYARKQCGSSSGYSGSSSPTGNNASDPESGKDNNTHPEQ
jgi:hypothetical protein